MSRFPNVMPAPEGSRFSNLSERLKTPLPGENVMLAPVSELLATMRANANDQSKRLPAFRTQVAARPKANVPLAPIAKPDPAAAIRVAKSEARARHAAVMASDAVTGREKQAARLLLASCSTSAKLKNSKAIIAELQSRPLDAAIAVQQQSHAEAGSDAIWARAWAVAETNQPLLGSKASANEREIDAMWARAYSMVTA